MTPEIIFLGTDYRLNPRVWGYLKTDELDDRWYTSRSYFVFWGVAGGAIHFQRSKNDDTFRKSAKKKMIVYRNKQDGLHHKILNEFGQYQLARKLRHGF